MNFKKIIAGASCVAILLSSNIITFAETANTAIGAPPLASNSAQMLSPKTEYISIDDYFAKYGEENIIAGFNEAEAAHAALLNNESSESVNAIQNDAIDNEPNDVYLSLKEGKFLGLDIIDVSDLPPDDIRFSVRLKDDSFSERHNIANATTQPENNNAVARAGNQKKSYAFFDVYYSDNEPLLDGDLYGGAYEPTSGTYMYKFSYAYDNNYLCSTNVQFSNTQLKCGSQQNNMYTYIAAKPGKETLDFGLMANPSADNRNKGMYACYNPGKGVLEVETYPKVQATSYGNNAMTLENKTVTIRLSVGNGTVEMYMESNGSCIYYKVENMPGFISGSGKQLTFLQAMSCVEHEGKTTNLTSGAYFKNVRFSNTQLYSYDSSFPRSFSTYGPYTYYTFIANPSKMTFVSDSSSNYESMSINYN